MADEGIRLALVGAGSMVGESVLAVFADSTLSTASLVFLDSEDEAGERIRFRGKEYRVGEVGEFDFAETDLAIFVADAAISAAHAPRAAAAGCVVLDASGYFHDDPSVPLILPEVNPELLEEAGRGAILALPSAAASQLVTLLKPLHDTIGLQRVDVTAMLAVSELGRGGVEELSSQAVSLFNMRQIKPSLLPQQIVFNILPQVGTVESDGFTDVESQLVEQAGRLLGDSAIDINVTAVWAPVFFGHSLSIHLQFAEPVTLEPLQELLAAQPAVSLEEEPSAVEEAANSPLIYVGRLRLDRTQPEGAALWTVADNLRYGVARNVIRLAEILEKNQV